MPVRISGCETDRDGRTAGEAAATLEATATGPIAGGRLLAGVAVVDPKSDCDADREAGGGTGDRRRTRGSAAERPAGGLAPRITFAVDFLFELGSSCESIERTCTFVVHKRVSSMLQPPFTSSGTTTTKTAYPRQLRVDRRL
jgi:hypothetical protein